jgi:hypothetical protein
MSNKRVFQNLSLSEDEKAAAKKICQLKKFTQHRPSDEKVLALRAFIFGVGLVNMLLENGQYDVLLIILSFLSAKDLVRLSASANSAFIELFWLPENSKFRKLFSNNFFLKSYFHDEPCQKRLASLTTGDQILREFR